MSSNPSVMICGACCEEGRRAASARTPWVTTTLTPGARVVTEYG
ncbi:hypothetical protein [Rhodococcus sp. ZPP]|nr:hypothetical protein [Rhodococcus sp. ZPP]